MIPLKDLIDGMGGIAASLDLSGLVIKGITDDSRQVKEGFLFIAVKGEKADGNSFIDEAIKKGARAIVAQSPITKSQLPIKNKVPFLEVKDARAALAKLAAKFYGYPSRIVKCIGVTGTNGKTTITYILENILKQAGFNCGVIGTVNYHFNDKIIPASNTTPNPIILESLLSEMRVSGVNYCALEVSSHSLEQQRVAGIDFRYAIFTNLASDHLDYHGNRLYYFAAKAKLFKMLNKQAHAIINIDDEHGIKLLKNTSARVITYGIDNNSDVRAQDLKLASCGTEFKVTTAKGEFNIKTKLIGKHNVYNILSAIAVTSVENISLENIVKGIESLEKVSGRLEKVEGDYPFSIFVDYAHTEDALKNVLISLSKIKHNKIIVVFGCGGDRDRSKRPKMGYTASTLSDFVIVTSDNPRSEDPDKIIDEIISSIKKENFTVIPDRHSAIEKALFMADMGDIVLIAGKGHEQYQIFKDKIIHFDDYKTAKDILEKRYHVYA
ncbi:MAG: UDP-N-acetylmuramoyl-L-alanyl-D-glutamate--2,6-diaminopimelate ligase [Candidatus Omnitrophota bacterium]